MESSVPMAVSTCTSETATGKHVFRIADYHIRKGLGVGEYIQSATFAIGGYDWRVRYYPNGAIFPECSGYVSVYLELLTRDAKVRADYEFRLIDSGRAPPPSPVTHLFTNKYNTVDPDEAPANYGAPRFMKQQEIKPYLRDDCLEIECEVLVINAITKLEVQEVPPSDLPNHLRKLLDGKRGADVTFEVKGEVFSAHKIMLATRSPVFDAQLDGPLTITNMIRTDFKHRYE